MARNDDNRTLAHNTSVRQILDAAQNSWQAVTQLQASDDLSPDAVFAVEPRHGGVSLLRRANAHLLSYHSLVANKQYTVNAADLWEETITDARGDPYEVTVPANAEVWVERDNLRLADIETASETLALETLGDRWAFRHVTVHRERPSSFGATQVETAKRRVWLPPKAIALVFNQLEDVRAKLQLGVDIKAPDWDAQKVLDPTEGLRDPYSEEVDG